MCSICTMEEQFSYRGPAAGSSAEPGRTTAALVSSIPCRSSPPSPASSPRNDRAEDGEKKYRESLLTNCAGKSSDEGKKRPKSNPDKCWRGFCCCVQFLDSSLPALLLHSRLVSAVSSDPPLVRTLKLTEGCLRLHSH